MGNVGDVNAQDGDGNTALHKVAMVGSIEGIRALKEAGADLAIENNLGEKAADVLCECQDESFTTLQCDNNCQRRNKRKGQRLLKV